MVCSDNQVDRLVIKKAGIAENCGEYVYYINLNGKAVPQRGIACQKFDGRWEVVHN
jgi:surface antigen